MYLSSPLVLTSFLPSCLLPSFLSSSLSSCLLTFLPVSLPFFLPPSLSFCLLPVLSAYFPFFPPPLPSLSSRLLPFSLFMPKDSISLHVVLFPSPALTRLAVLPLLILVSQSVTSRREHHRGAISLSQLIARSHDYRATK